TAADKAVDTANGAQHRILHDVFCVGRRAREPACKIVGRVEMRQGLCLEAPAPVLHAPDHTVRARDLFPGSDRYPNRPISHRGYEAAIFAVQLPSLLSSGGGGGGGGGKDLW